MLKLKLQYFGHDVKNWLIWKDPDAGKDWRREEKGMIEDEMVGSHHWLNGHETPGVGDGQGGLACCRVHGVTKSRTRLSNWSKVKTMWPHGLYSPWNSPGQNTGVDSHSLLQRIFLQPRDWTRVSHIAGGFSANWATREAHMPEVIYYSNLFVTAQDWKQLKCPHTGEWLNKLWYIHIMNMTQL